YMDAFGWVLIGVLAVPVSVFVSDFLSDLLWGYAIPRPVGSPTIGPFSIAAGFIGLLAGLCGRLGVFRPRPGHDRRAQLLTTGAVALVVLIAAYTYGRAYASVKAFNATTGYDTASFTSSRVAF